MNTSPITADTATLFKDPETGLLHSIDKAWIWALFFGPLYFLVKRAWLYAGVFFLVSMAIPGLVNIFYAFIAQRLLRDLYNKKGWIPQDPSVLKTTKLLPPIAILLGNKDRSRDGTSSPESVQSPVARQYPDAGPTPPAPKPAASPVPNYTPAPDSQSGMTSESRRNLGFNIVFAIGAVIIIATTLFDTEINVLLEQIKSLIENN